MTVPPQENQVQEKANDKELNFRQLEARYERQLAQERAARLEAEKMVQEAQTKKLQNDDDDDDSEPYVGHKQLNKKLSKFEQTLSQKFDKSVEEKARGMIQEERQQTWLKNNPDFFETIKQADKLAQRDPELAETILAMPEGFERQKLAYRAIKNMGLDKPEVKAPSIQEKIDANKRSPYYQPSGVASAPYAAAGDFSPQGQKQAYAKLQELKNKLRI